MNGIPIRGARTVLPLLFMLGVLPVFAATAPSYADLYRVFSMPLSEASGWLKKDKGDRVKDIFLARYHLPLAFRGGIQRISVEVVKSYNAAQEYASFYIEAPKRETCVFFVSGILKGAVVVNGEQKGVLSPAGPFDHSTIELTMEPGIYSVLFSFERPSRDASIVVLADRPVTFSSRGFTKNFRSSVKVREHSCPEGELLEWLYEKRVFPAPQDDDRGYKAGRSFYEEPDAMVDNMMDEKTPLLFLLRHSKEKKAQEMLKAIGFDEKELEWWERFLGKTGKGKREAP